MDREHLDGAEDPGHRRGCDPGADVERRHLRESRPRARQSGRALCHLAGPVWRDVCRPARRVLGIRRMDQHLLPRRGNTQPAPQHAACARDRRGRCRRRLPARQRRLPARHARQRDAAVCGEREQHPRRRGHAQGVREPRGRLRRRADPAVHLRLFMIFYALSMFGLKFFRRFQFNPKFLTKIASKTSEHKGPYKTPFFTGLLNGLFLACGPLQAMYLYAAGTGNFFTGAASLAVFGLGTLPVMLGFGSLATVISHTATKRILKVSAIIVLILGLIMLNRGLALTGSNFSFDAIKTSLSGSSGISANSLANGGAVINNGVQEVNMNVGSNGYSPNSFVLKKGVPVKWNVNVVELTSCNSELVMNAYGIDKQLQKGLNVIEFTPKTDGTISFTCGMGMLHGNFIVTENGTASQDQVRAATPKAGSTCSMSSSGGGCGCGM